MNLIKIKKIIVQHEQTDFFNLVWTLAAIVLGWLIIESNFVAHMFMNNDALFQLPSLQNILKNGGPSSVFYRPDIIGGTPVADILGRLPIYDLAAFFGWPVVLTMNLGLMLSQVLVAFLGAKATVSLAKLWGYEAKVSGLQFALIAATFAFMPVVASRVQYGHLDLIYGMLLFSVIASLLICARAGDLSLTFFTAITIALWHCVTSQGHQIKLYSVVFGLPILISLCFTIDFNKSKEWVTTHKKYVLSAVVLLMGAAIFSLPRFLDMFLYARSSDSLRGLGKESVLYSYPGTEIYNYFASLPFNYKILAKTLDPLRISESYFSVGSLILVLVLLRRKQLFVLIGLGLSLFLSMALALKWSPINDWMTQVVPTLKSFRVPERSLIPFCMSIPMISLALILINFENKPPLKSYLWLLGLLILPLTLTGASLEIFYWVFALAVLILFYKKLYKNEINATVVILIFLVASVQAFQVWRMPAKDRTSEIHNAAQVGQQLKETVPSLKSPLSRTYIDAIQKDFNVSTGALMNVSTLSGYWNPTRRFKELVQALRGVPYPATAVYFNFSPEGQGMKALQGLYNVCCDIEPGAQGAISVKTIDYTAGPIWASSSAEIVSSFDQLAGILNSQASNLPYFLKSKWLLNSSDPIVQKNILDLRGKNFDQCSAGSMSAPNVSSDGQVYTFDANFTQSCPVTLAMNYYEKFSARVVSGEGLGQAVITLPAYGSLLSAIVPKGRNKIEITAIRATPLVHHFLSLVGLVLILIAGWLLYSGFSGAPSAPESSGWGAKKKRKKIV